MIEVGDDVAGFVWNALDDLEIEKIALSSIRKGVEKLQRAQTSE